MKQAISPKDLARAIGVSESSMKRWTDEGLIAAVRTAGGHRRIPIAEAIRFIRSMHATVVRPDLLGISDLAVVPSEFIESIPTPGAGAKPSKRAARSAAEGLPPNLPNPPSATSPSSPGGIGTPERDLTGIDPTPPRQPAAGHDALPPVDDSATVEPLYDALERGDAALVRGMIQALYLRGLSMSEIFDGPIRGAMIRIGELWLHQEWGIAVEHRATDLCIQALTQLRLLQSHASSGAPVACGGGFESDPYLLPSMMAAAVFAEAGYRDVNLGPKTPGRVLVNAVKHYHASIAWLSLSSHDDFDNRIAMIQALSHELADMRVRLVVGGRAISMRLDPSIQHIGAARVIRSMAELAALAIQPAADATGPSNPAHGQPRSSSPPQPANPNDPPPRDLLG